MTDSLPDSSQRTTLASRLSTEMEQAESQGFGTATVWLTRAEIDLICAALVRPGGHYDVRHAPPCCD